MFTDTPANPSDYLPQSEDEMLVRFTATRYCGRTIRTEYEDAECSYEGEVTYEVWSTKDGLCVTWDCPECEGWFDPLLAKMDRPLAIPGLTYEVRADLHGPDGECVWIYPYTGATLAEVTEAFDGDFDGRTLRHWGKVTGVEAVANIGGRMFPLATFDGEWTVVGVEG